VGVKLNLGNLRMAEIVNLLEFFLQKFKSSLIGFFKDVSVGDVNESTIRMCILSANSKQAFEI
jgi:hypothetical protein